MSRHAQLFVVTALAIAVAAPIWGQNLLVNPTLDSDVTGWENPYLDRVDWISDDGNPSGSGDGCLEIADNDNNGASTGAIQEVAVTPETGYYLSGWTRIPAGSVAVGAQIWVQWYDASGAFLGSSDFFSMRDLSGAWNRLAAVVTSPVDAVKALVRPSFQMPSMGTEESIARWDHLYFGDPSGIAEILIDFDEAPGGGAVVSGTDLASLYAPFGVTFEHGGGGSSCGTTIYANSNHPGGFGSLPNVVTICDDGTASDIAENDHGLVQANLAHAALQACIEVRPGEATDFAVLRAFDEAGSQISEVFSAAGVTETLCVSGAGIRSVRFSGSGDNYARFDDLSVDFDPLAVMIFFDGFESGGTSAWSSSVP